MCTTVLVRNKVQVIMIFNNNIRWQTDKGIICT